MTKPTSPPAATTRRVPVGWQLVPVEPTHEMFLADWNARDAFHARGSNPTYRTMVGYKAMLAAASTPDVTGVGSLTREEIMQILRYYFSNTAHDNDVPMFQACRDILALLARGAR